MRSLLVSLPSSAPLLAHSLTIPRPSQCLLTVEHYYYISITAYYAYIYIYIRYLPHDKSMGLYMYIRTVSSSAGTVVYMYIIILSRERIGTTDNIYSART